MKKFLFVLRTCPHNGAWAKEMLDVILTTAAFDQPVSILLLDDGVFQIKKNQNPDFLGMKDTAAIFKALELYDVNDIFVETESLSERGLNVIDLCIPTESLSQKDISQFMERFDVVFSG